MLSIQKIVLLLEQPKLNTFKQYLKENNHNLSLKLVSSIEKSGRSQKSSDQLCEMVYGDMDAKSKRKFFQLAHHTFKLTSYINRNYPYYLNHNLTRIEHLINEDGVEEANFYADILLDISEKIEDYQTQVAVLNFLSQQAFVLEHRADTERYHKKLGDAIDNMQTINEVYTYLRANFNFKNKKSITDPDPEKHLEFYGRYHQHPSVTVQLLSRYASCYTLNYLEDSRFYSDETFDEIKALIKELEKQSYLIIPFSSDIQLNIDYLYLKHIRLKLNHNQLQKESIELIKKWKSRRFWKNYTNTPQIISLSIQASFYITRYCVTYKENYEELIPKDAREQIKYLSHTCKEMLENTKWDEGFFVRYLNLSNIYCTFLLLQGPDNIKQAIKIIESMLINYQQISFQKLYDSIFVTLMIGYFSLGDYSAVQDTFKRYEKLTANKARNEENLISFKAFYYAAQWISTSRKQYTEKLQQLLQETTEKEKMEDTYQIIVDMIDYHNIPVSMENIAI